jgi:hypothetical protein
MRTGILHAANEGANPVSGFVLVRIPVVVRYPFSASACASITITFSVYCGNSK